MSQIEVVLTSPPERDDFLAELLDEANNAYIGAVDRREGVTYFNYSVGDRQMRAVELRAFIQALQAAEQSLIEE